MRGIGQKGHACWGFSQGARRSSCCSCFSVAAAPPLTVLDSVPKCFGESRCSANTNTCTQAQRLLDKAQRMFPSAESESLAAACAHKLHSAAAAANSTRANQEEGAANRNRRGPYTSHPQGPRQRRASRAAAPPHGAEAENHGFSRSRSSGTTGSPSAAAAPAHTPEQARLCEVVLREKCYYGVLGVPKNASEEVIRKAYRRVSFLSCFSGATLLWHKG